MDKPEKKWKRFEHLVYKIQKDFAPDAVVTLNHKIKGQNSGGMRQVDISVQKDIGQYSFLIAIDCKDYSKPVDVKSVEETIGLFKDIGAHQGVIVASKGFTKKALKVGKQACLSLYRLVDTEDHDWKSKVTIPVFYRLIRLASFQLIISSRGTGYFSLPIDEDELINLEAYTEENIPLGTIKDLLYKKWFDGDIPFENNILNKFDFIGQLVKLKHNEKIFDASICANIFIEKECYFQKMPISKISGFMDEHTSKIITKGFTTSNVSLDIVRSSQKVDDESELAIKPVLQFVLLN